MALMENYPETCRERATNPEYPLELLDSVKREFEKGMELGFIDPSYILPKLKALTSHVEWCRIVASEQFKAQCEA